MADGYLLTGALWSQLLPDPPVPTPQPLYDGGGHLTYASPGSVRPREQTPTGRSAYARLGFWEDFKNTLFLQPSVIDLGAILTASTHSIRIWSSYESKITAPSITRVGTTGLELIGRTTNVALADHGGYSDYTLNVTMGVSGVLDAKFTWEFPGISTALKTLSVTGTRVIVYDPPPQKRVTERLSWHTAVIKTMDSKEQRIRLKTYPAVEVTYRSLTNIKDSSKYEAMLFGLGHGALAVPVWHEAVRYIGSLPIGTTAISLDTRGSNFLVGERLVLWTGMGQYETAEVESVTDTKIVLKSALLKSWDSPLVAPMFYGNVDRSDFNKYRVAAVDSVVTYTRTTTELTAEAQPYPVFDGLPILTGKLHTFSKTSPVAISHEVTQLQLGFTPPKNVQQFTFPNVSRDVDVVLSSQREVRDFKKWLGYLGGKQRPFWYRSGRKEIVVYGTSLQDTDTLTIEDIGFAEHYVVSPTRKWIAVQRSSDLTWEYYEIQSVTKVDPTVSDPALERLKLTRNLPYAHTSESVNMVCLMSPVRLDSDQVTIVWDNLNHAKCSLKVLEVSK